jgi:hypothetical protein
VRKNFSGGKKKRVSNEEDEETKGHKGGFLKINCSNGKRL